MKGSRGATLLPYYFLRTRVISIWVISLNESTQRRVRFEALLGIASVLMLVGSLGPWEVFLSISSNALYSWHGVLAFIGGMLAIFATTVSYNLYRLDFLQKFRPYTDGRVGALGSLLALIGAFAFFGSLSPGASPTWGLYLTIIAGFFGLFSAYGVYREGTPSIPKGLSGEGVTP